MVPRRLRNPFARQRPELDAGPAAVTSTTGSGDATQVIDEVAVSSSGQPINGYRETTTGEPTQVDCTLASPAAVADNIYTCSPSAASADVCWPAADRELLCMIDPWTKELHGVRASAPLPAVSPREHPEPVALLLGDGSQCRLRNGGSWGSRTDGYYGAYWCGAGHAVVLVKPDAADAIDRSAPVWTVKVGKLGAPTESLPPPDTVEVVTAWFASDQAAQS